jgi:hypothetical protein
LRTEASSSMTAMSFLFGGMWSVLDAGRVIRARA